MGQRPINIWDLLFLCTNQVLIWADCFLWFLGPSLQNKWDRLKMSALDRPLRLILRWKNYTIWPIHDLQQPQRRKELSGTIRNPKSKKKGAYPTLGKLYALITSSNWHFKYMKLRDTKYDSISQHRRCLIRTTNYPILNNSIKIPKWPHTDTTS